MMRTSAVIAVLFGVGQLFAGPPDDTQTLQRAINAIAGTGGTLTIPAGVYHIDPVANGGAGLRLGSHMTLVFAPGAVIEALPTSEGNSALLAIWDVEDVTVRGGTLMGERTRHRGTEGEWGMGISVARSSRVALEDLVVRDCWGDGIYVTERSRQVTIDRVTSDHNRRQGLSVTSVDGLVVRDSVFQNTRGTLPECGIDLEPNEGETIDHALITGCTLRDNAGSGFQVGSAEGSTTTAIRHVVFEANLVVGNGLGPVDGGYRAGILVSHATSGARVVGNRVEATRGQGIMVCAGSAGTVVEGNRITGTLQVEGHPTWTGGAIYVSESPGTRVVGNRFEGNAGPPVWNVDEDPTLVIEAN